MSKTDNEILCPKKNLKTPEGINATVILKNKNQSKKERKENAKQIKRLRIMGKLPFCHTHEITS